ncbi:GNAT family N-acetyltransferase [Streptomyces sp. SID11385]|nr:GNAT family N-acetyltransferase [Streptomyces sp. SID11385]
MREGDLPLLYEMQLDEEARRLAAFVSEETRDGAAFVAKHRKILADPAITFRGVEVAGELVGSAAVFPIEQDIELAYWVRRDLWGRGVATAAVAALLKEVTARPVHARVVADNPGSVRVLERNGFVRIGSEDSYADGRGATVTELVLRLDDPR